MFAVDADCTAGRNQNRLSQTRTDVKKNKKPVNQVSAQNQTAKAALKTIPLKSSWKILPVGNQEMGLIFSADADKQ